MRHEHVNVGTGEMWDRQPEETQKAYEAFIAYRDMEHPRSARRVAEQLGYARMHPVVDWSAEHNWVARVAAWTAEVDRLKRQAMLDEAAEMGRRQARQAASIQTALVQPVEEWLARIEKRRAAGKDPFRGYSDKQLLNAIEVASRAFTQVAVFERLARGMSTSHAHLDVTVSALDARVAEARQRAEGMSRTELDAYLLGAADAAEIEMEKLDPLPGQRVRNSAALDARRAELLERNPESETAEIVTASIVEG